MKSIPLTQGKFAVVDDSDFEALSKFKWFAMKNNRHWCAARNAPKKNGKRGTVYMHRQIMGFPAKEVDHRDRNGLHNWRSNLRLATDAQQAANKTSENSIGFRGVKRKFSKWKLAKPFEARINQARRYVCLGHYETPEQAARAYDRAARRIYGEFAVLNFPKL